MEGSVQIGTIFGIPIRLHFTFLLIIPLFAWIIGMQIDYTAVFLKDAFMLTEPIDMTLIKSGFMPYILGTIVALGLFAGVLVHELAHSLVAKSRGLKINNITLLILGGVASMEEITPDPKIELPMALAGPLMSLFIGFLCSGLAYVFYTFIGNTAIASLLFYVFGYLGLLNIILFAFNMLPAFPMDGGRVLRAWLAMHMPLQRATRIAADLGRGFAILFGIIGVFILNPILVIIAIFIYLGAGQEASMVRHNILLKDITVADAMSSPVVTVSPTLPVEEVIKIMYSSHHLGFPVVDRNALVGIVTLADVHSATAIDREAQQVKDIMSDTIITLTPGAPLTDALKIMSVKNIGRIPVIEENNLVGIVTRTDILRVMELKEI